MGPRATTDARRAAGPSPRRPSSSRRSSPVRVTTPCR